MLILSFLVVGITKSNNDIFIGSVANKKQSFELAVMVIKNIYDKVRQKNFKGITTFLKEAREIRKKYSNTY